jgi:hypothetical protein
MLREPTASIVYLKFFYFSHLGKDFPTLFIPLAALLPNQEKVFCNLMDHIANEDLIRVVYQFHFPSQFDNEDYFPLQECIPAAGVSRSILTSNY